MKKLLSRLLNRETLLYLIFGVLTTLVNLAVFWLMNRLLGEDLALLNNAVAFVAAVIFAYLTNKRFVFESRSWDAATLKREIPSFLGARLASFGLEELLLWIAKDLIRVGRWSLVILGLTLGGLMIAKILISVIVVVLNYIFSKFFIFKQK
ncbi:MAG: GtrA family protein [Oscillospiraceae bacterium]|nr:GtrA family protein [Oscillospiraceae bacterium]